MSGWVDGFMRIFPLSVFAPPPPPPPPHPLPLNFPPLPPLLPRMHVGVVQNALEPRRFVHNVVFHHIPHAQRLSLVQ